MMTDENLTPTAEPEGQPVAAPLSEASPTPSTEAAPVAAELEPVDVSPAEPEALPVTSTEPVADSAEATPAPVAEPETPTVEEPVAPAPVAEVPAAPVAPVAPVVTTDESDVDLFEAAMRSLEAGEDTDRNEGSFKKLQRGDRIEATIIQVDNDKVFVDLGTKSEGIIPLGELSEENLESAKGHFNIGDKINVVVIRPEGAEGNPIVSKRRADFEEVWDRIEESFRDKVTIQSLVVDRVKGGLVVDIGVRGFVPATHVGSGKLRNIEKYVGQSIGLKIIEIDRERKKVVLSNREAEEERRVSAKEEIFKVVKPGDVLEGSVRRLTDYGAFIDLGGVDGLLHISEMSWMRINNPKEMFKEGQKIKVMVLRLDAAVGKISLGHRQVLPDPWNLIRQNYTNNQKLTVTIGRLVQSGAFIKLPEGAEAFLPLSEMSFRRLRRPQEAVEENQEVEVQIIDLRPEERRMVLSLRALGGGAGEQQSQSPQGGGGGGYEDERKGGPKKKGGKKGVRGGGYEDEFDEGGRRGFATGGATIGERLGMLKGLLSRDDDDEDEKESGANAAADSDGDEA
ncbi:MAG: S1 RNA-binding domain-containing protein [Fimbriimonas sp.]